MESIETGEANIIIGTQMITKGHHFPNITLAGVINADQGLFSADYRASERLAQLLVQVSGRAGRGLKQGRVFIQTHYPNHPLLQTSKIPDYDELSETIMAERCATDLPPYNYHALLRAEAQQLDHVKTFLTNAKNRFTGDTAIEVLGPIVAPIEKRGGRYRMQLLLQSNNRKTLHKPLDAWLEYLESSESRRKVRWSIDIDPQNML